MATDRTLKIAATIYAENANQDYDTMVMTGSSIKNRESAGKPKEFGSSLDEVMTKGYYAVSNNTPLYQQAISGKFPDEKSEAAYKKALQVAYGLETGETPLHPAQFFFKKGEAVALRKKLKSQGKVGIYDTFSY